MLSKSQLTYITFTPLPIRSCPASIRPFLVMAYLLRFPAVPEIEIVYLPTLSCDKPIGYEVLSYGLNSVHVDSLVLHLVAEEYLLVCDCEVPWG